MTTFELYRIQPESFMNLPYHEALVVKRDAAKAHVAYLLRNSYLNIEDPLLFNKVYDAIKFNDNLLAELPRS